MRATLTAAAAALLCAFTSAQAAEFKVINLTVAHAWSGVAPCTTPGRQTAESIETTLNKAMADAPRVDASASGYNFVDQPAPLVDAFRQLTLDLPRRIRPSACHDVLCATRQTFGDERAARLLLLASVYRFNAAQMPNMEQDAWSLADLDQLIAAFSDMPVSLFPLKTDEYRLLAQRRHRPGLGHEPTQLFQLAAEAGEGTPGILISPGWRRADEAERRAIIVHEIAHEFTRARGPGLNWRARWQAAIEADEARALEGREPVLSVASAYAQNNLEEDFAESMTAYRYMAPLLKRRAPARYALLKAWVFEGREYGSAAGCRS